MKIALVHSFYRGALPSGENQVVQNQRLALLEAGHQVELVGVHSDDLKASPLYTARSAYRVISGYGSSGLLGELPFTPDVVHVHNTFPNIGFRAFDRVEVPLVHTLHNFRPYCAAATLYRSGGSCFECVEGTSLHAVRHGCYHDSRLQTVPLALRNLGDPSRHGILNRADALVVGTDKAYDLYCSFGIPPEKLHVIPNGVQSVGVPAAVREQEETWLVAARLDPEKGVLDLVRSWPESERLEVYGAGPELPEILSRSNRNVDYQGVVDYTALRARLGRVSGLIIPSKWLEMNPTIISDALSVGTPIVAFSANVGAELVRKLRVGAVYSDPSTLAGALTEVRTAGQPLRERCLAAFEENFSLEAWASNLITLYQGLTQ